MLEHHDSSQRHSGSGQNAAQSELEHIPLLDAASTVTVSVEILKESHEEILAIAREYGYGDEEGVRTVLLSGLGYESGRMHLDALNHAAKLGTELSAARVDAIVNELAGYHSMYSVLKYKAFKLYKQNQRLEFNNAGLRAQEQMWQEWSDRMRRERESLSAEVLRLRSLLAEFRLDWESSGGPQLPSAIIEETLLAKPELTTARSETVESDSVDYIQPRIEEPRLGLWARIRRFLGSS